MAPRWLPPASPPAAGSIALAPGLHSFQLLFFQITGGAAMTCSYSGPDTGGATVLVPAATTPTGAGLLSGLPTTINALNPAFPLTFTGNINGGGSLIKGGPGNLQLTALDTNTGTANVQGGNLTLTGNGILAQIAGLIVSNATTLTTTPSTGILASPGGVSAVQTLTFGSGRQRRHLHPDVQRPDHDSDHLEFDRRHPASKHPGRAAMRCRTSAPATLWFPARPTRPSRSRTAWRKPTSPP